MVACSGPVAVEPPDIDSGNTMNATVLSVCSELSAQLPDTVADQEFRATEPESPFTAAWGTPAIVLRCGVPRPAALSRTSQLISINGVDWFAEELTSGYLFTTYGRQVYVEVTVPDDYAPEAGPVTEISAAVTAAVPERAKSRTSSP
jgi:hypothetical protein